MGNTYQININDAVGRLQLAPRDWRVLDYVRTENEVGSLTLTLPGVYPQSLFRKDGLIEVWRSVDGAPPYLDTDTLWMIRRRRWRFKARTSPTWTIYAVDLNSLLKRRTVDYGPSDATHFNPYTDKLAAADDLGKAIVRENLGTLALDTTRDLSTYLSVAGDLAQAPVLHVETLSRRNVLKALQDLANASYQAGTYLVFDVVCDRLPGDPAGVHFQFRSYIGQRGNDHRWPDGQPPLLIGADYDNLDNVDDDNDATDEITSGIATVGVDSSQAAETLRDLARLAESPFNLIESVRSTTAVEAGALLAEAGAELQAGIPRELMSGTLVNTSGLLYGPDWSWGDFLTVQGQSGASDTHAARVHVHVERDAGDQVETVLSGAVAS